MVGYWQRHSQCVATLLIRRLLQRQSPDVRNKAVRVSPTIEHVWVGGFEPHPAIDHLGAARFLTAPLSGDQLSNVGCLLTHCSKAFNLRSRLIVTVKLSTLLTIWQNLRKYKLFFGDSQFCVHASQLHHVKQSKNHKSVRQYNYLFLKKKKKKKKRKKKKEPPSPHPCSNPGGPQRGCFCGSPLV